MKYIYISRPLRENFKDRYNLVQQAIEKKVRNKNLLLDPNDCHSVLSYLDWTKNSDISISEYCEYYIQRLRGIAMADLVIFIEDWMDLIECKFDWGIVKLFNKTNYLTFKSYLNYSTGEIDLKLTQKL